MAVSHLCTSLCCQVEWTAPRFGRGTCSKSLEQKDSQPRLPGDLRDFTRLSQRIVVPSEKWLGKQLWDNNLRVKLVIFNDLECYKKMPVNTIRFLPSLFFLPETFSGSSEVLLTYRTQTSSNTKLRYHWLHWNPGEHCRTQIRYPKNCFYFCPLF